MNINAAYITLEYTIVIEIIIYQICFLIYNYVQVLLPLFICCYYLKFNNEIYNILPLKKVKTISMYVKM